MRIALFGGSFDPIHLAHTLIAREAVAAAGLDRVYFIPARQSPHKTEAARATAEDRCEMIRLAIRELPWAHLDTLELERPAPSYSWQTAEAFQAAFPDAELFWIMGTDQWDALERWARPERLAELLTFVVFTRGGEIAPKAGFRHLALEVHHPASSTAIRASREKAREFLDPAVYEYASARGLYAWDSPS